MSYNKNPETVEKLPRSTCKKGTQRWCGTQGPLVQTPLACCVVASANCALLDAVQQATQLRELRSFLRRCTHGRHGQSGTTAISGKVDFKERTIPKAKGLNGESRQSQKLREISARVRKETRVNRQICDEHCLIVVLTS